MTRIISDPKATRYVAEFIPKAGMLGQFREAELTTAEPPRASRSSITLRADAEDDGYMENTSSAGQLSNIKTYRIVHGRQKEYQIIRGLMKDGIYAWQAFWLSLPFSEGWFYAISYVNWRLGTDSASPARRLHS
jgi:hypothetical protein